jgi:hypothetical protein
MIRGQYQLWLIVLTMILYNVQSNLPMPEERIGNNDLLIEIMQFIDM